jgi:ABC-type transporter Mla subunit MlaD
MAKRKSDSEKLLVERDAFVKKARAIVDRMAKARDELRALVEEYESVLEYMDDSIEDFDRVLDHLSEII